MVATLTSEKIFKKVESEFNTEIDKLNNNLIIEKNTSLMMQEKITKSVYIPLWINEILDLEGDKYDGPGMVVSAAVFDFSKKKRSDKIKAIQRFRSKEVEMAYFEDVDFWAIFDEIVASRKSRQDASKVQKSKQLKSG